MLLKSTALCLMALCFFHTSSARAQTVYMMEGTPTAADISAALSGGVPAKTPDAFDDSDDDFDMQSLVISSSGQDALASEADVYRSAAPARDTGYTDMGHVQEASFSPPGTGVNASALGLRINFANNSSHIASSNKKVITSLAEALKNDPDSYTLITGHADSSGAERYNQLLSFERAASLRHALAKHGVPAWRVVVMGYGSLMPLPGLTKNDARNRRIQIWKMTPDVSENSQHTASRERNRG